MSIAEYLKQVSCEGVFNIDFFVEFVLNTVAVQLGSLFPGFLTCKFHEMKISLVQSRKSSIFYGQ